MNRQTITLAIPLAASIALAIGAITVGPVHAQCGNGPNHVPCENEKEKKVGRTEVPPTATSTPTPEPTATPTPPPPTASPTATQTPLPAVIEVDPGEVVAFGLPLTCVLGLLILIGAVAAILLAPRFLRAGAIADASDQASSEDPEL